jgi:GDPmannose 4,6-dehydratase
MRRSLVIGVNGQDGSYLAEGLLRRGYDVVGIAKDSTSRYVSAGQGFTYETSDLRDLDSFERLVQRLEPDVVFHFAAIHGAAGFEYEPVWRDMMAVNVLSLHVLLEYARLRNPSLRIVYAGSAKMYPNPLVGTIDEATCARATCLYSIGKIASRDLVGQYRNKHNISATNLVFFNHDSVRRPSNYFLPMIARSIVCALRDPSSTSDVKTLDFWIDWSSAAELMDLSIDIAEKSDLDEIVMASGETWNGRVAVRQLFEHYGLAARDHIIEALPPRDPGEAFHVKIDRLVAAAGRRPCRSLFDIVDEMVEAAESVTAAAPGRRE